MKIFNSIISWMFKKRIHQIELFKKYPIEVQQELFAKLLEKAKNTAFGKEYKFSEIKNQQQFSERVPVSAYEGLYPYIEKTLKGEQNILWPTEIRWFAKSSGTTSKRSKFIPVSQEALEDCHFKGGKDLFSFYVNNYPQTKLFQGKNLAVGGSSYPNEFNKKAKTYYGDVSAVIMANLPVWAQFARTPKLEIALMDDWEEKLQKMAELTIKQNVTSLSGVPTWTLVLLQKILEITEKEHILEVWPNLELFIHGAVAFSPYKLLFKKIIPSETMRYMETYNASEGFFGIQDQVGSDELLLMLDYGVFYEFISMDEIEKENPDTIQLSEVELDKNYALVISTNAGLWRYKIGDTIRFTSLFPYRFKITGRTKHFINAFGEEVIVENAEKAITQASHATGAVINNFTAAPRYFGEKNKGCHEWVIEFENPPDNLDKFILLLDQSLREANSDYDAKRYKDIALQKPIVHQVAAGTFYQWMKKRGKLGSQNKVPRLSNNRDYMDDILEMIQAYS